MKMKKQIKLLSSALAIIMGISLLAGCGNTQKTSNNNPTTNAGPEKPITIDWMPQNDQPVNSESPVIKELEKLLNVKINFVYMDRNKEVELLNIRVASGEIPDVMRMMADRFGAYIKQGVLSEIPEDQLKKTAPKLYEMTLKNSGDTKIWEYAKEGGKLYGLPNINLNGSYGYVPVWRNDWLSNVGIDKMPETLKDAEEAFRKFANNDPDKNGKKDTYAMSDRGFSAIFGAYGVIPYNTADGSFYWALKDGKVTAAAILPEMKEALALLNKWYKEGLVDPEFITGENKGQNKYNMVALWNGKIGFSCPGLFYHVNLPMFEGDAGSTNYQNFKKLQGEKATYDLGKPLAGPNGKGVTEKWGTFNGQFTVLGRNVAKDPKKLQKILEIQEKVASDPQVYTLTMYGIKGVTYDMKKAGNSEVMSYIGDYSDSANKAKMGLDTNGLGYMLGNNFDLLKASNPVRYTYADKVSPSSTFANVVWAGLPSSPQFKAGIDKKVKEAYILFITGERKLEEFDKFVDELNKAGLEQLTKEANEWYKTFEKK